ncbi:MAG: flavin reductase [Pseudonocardiaceae bacterium]
MPPDLRSVMRNFATGVCLATTYADRVQGRRHDAVTVNSLTSVSLDPPLVSLCLRRDSGFLADLLETKAWAVSILDGGAADVARLFAEDRATRAAALDALGASPGHYTGALVLDAPSWLECVLWGSFDLGDHTMVVGEVAAGEVQQGGTFLIFLHGRYHTLENLPMIDDAVPATRLNLPMVVPEVHRAMVAFSQAAEDKLDPVIGVLVKVRASQLNGCAFCLDLHTREARAAGEREQRLYALAAWRETPFFTDRERAALALTEAVTLLTGGHVPDDVYQPAAAQFDQIELAHLLWTISAINIWNRMAVATRLRPAAGVDAVT